MATPFISPAVADKIDALKRRGFETSKLLGNVQSVTFWRDTNDDAYRQPFGPYEVLVVIPEQEGQARQGQASALTASDGEFRSNDPAFDVWRGDTFTLASGATGRVTLTPIDMGAYVRAPFEIEG